MPSLDLAKSVRSVDLEKGVVPISKAASSLAALLKRSQANHQPIVVTQKGYPTGVIIDIELFAAIRAFIEQNTGNDGAEPAAD